MTQTQQPSTSDRIGWLGVGRMGYAMARRLGEAGVAISVYNRSPEKARPLEKHGVQVVGDLGQLGTADVVFTMLSTGDVVEESLLGERGLLSLHGAKPRIVVDCSSISIETSARLRAALAQRGIAFLACPVSGNPHVVESGNCTFVCSGERAVFEQVQPLLATIGKAAAYVGEGELARVAKIAHNVWLGALTQSLAEVVVLAQKAGMTREAFMGFLNISALGSTYTKVKTPHWVALDFEATFTPALMRKDMDLGLDLARELDMPMPLSSHTRDLLQQLINTGDGTLDFSTLLLQQAKTAGLEMTPETPSGH